VSALRYEALVAQGRIPADTRVPIRTLDAKAVLHELPQAWAAAPTPAQGDTPARALQRALTRLPH